MAHVVFTSHLQREQSAVARLHPRRPGRFAEARHSFHRWQEHAYDLIYRHGLDVDSSGERLAMGSITGGVWLSINAGDSWRCLAARLPPIYCLRFASDD